MTMQEYKQKFIELVQQMEQEHGQCEYVTIQHVDKATTQYGTIISTNLQCTIEY